MKKSAFIEGVRRGAGYIPSDCPVFGICGGCAFRDIAYADEAAGKERLVLDMFESADIGGFDYAGFLSAENICRHRNKMEYAFGDDGPGGALTLGLRKKGSFYEAVNADDCMLVHEDFGRITKATREYFAKEGAGFYHRRRGTGVLRHLAVRRSYATGEILLNLVTATEAENLIDGWVSAVYAAKTEGKIASLWHTINDSPADVIKPEGARHIGKEPYIAERLLGLDFLVGPFSFFQTNTTGAARLYEAALGLLTDLKGKTVFDLYCGAGTITQICAKTKNAGRVIGVEINPEAVEAAVDAAAINGVCADFICGDVLGALDETDETPDVIVLDPPRDGLHPKALKKIASYNTSHILYISCNPTTLIRDLEQLSAYGYYTRKLIIVDMFPRAAHVECAALMEPQ